MRKTLSAFTIVELILVISIIGVLSTIGVVSYSSIHTGAVDSSRESKAKAIAEALEKYYEKNGEYPGCVAMTQSAATITSTILTDLTPDMLTTPSDTEGVNSIVCSELTDAATDKFSYVGDEGVECATGDACMYFSFGYIQESSDGVIYISGRHVVEMVALAKPIAAATANSLSQITVSWGSIPNAQSYTVERSTSSDFSSVVTTSGITTLSSVQSGLLAGTTYYFRVTALASGYNSTTSNSISKATPSLATPVATAQVNSGTQITLSWGAITYAASYTTHISTSSSFSSYTEYSNITGTTKVFDSLTTGTTYYFRVKAVASNDISDWSATATAATQVPAPTSLAVAVNSSTQVTASWSAVTGATSYTLHYDDNSSFSSPTIITGITATSKAVTGLLQGIPQYVRVYALINALSSSASSTASAITTIDTPGAPSFSIGITGTAYYTPANTPPTGDWLNSTSNSTATYYTARITTLATTNCASGTSAQFSFIGQYNAPTTWYGWTDFEASEVKYMIRPLDSYGVRIRARCRCATAYATSGISSYSDRCVWRSGSTSCTGFSG